MDKIHLTQEVVEAAALADTLITFIAKADFMPDNMVLAAADYLKRAGCVDAEDVEFMSAALRFLEKKIG